MVARLLCKILRHIYASYQTGCELSLNSLMWVVLTVQKPYIWWGNFMYDMMTSCLFMFNASPETLRASLKNRSLIISRWMWWERLHWTTDICESWLGRVSDPLVEFEFTYYSNMFSVWIANEVENGLTPMSWDGTFCWCQLYVGCREFLFTQRTKTRFQNLSLLSSFLILGYCYYKTSMPQQSLQWAF